jgi:hypothetical protein
LAASKTLAGRDKDREWIVAGIGAKLIDREVLGSRIEEVDIPRATKQAALRRLKAWVGRSSRQS